MLKFVMSGFLMFLIAKLTKLLNMNKGEGKKNGLHLHFSNCLSAILKECQGFICSTMYPASRNSWMMPCSPGRRHASNSNMIEAFGMAYSMCEIHFS